MTPTNQKLQILKSGPQKGYVVKVVSRNPLVVQLLDDIDGSTRREVGKSELIQTNYTPKDLATYCGLDAAKVEIERGWVDFAVSPRSKSRSRTKSKSKSQVKTIEDLLMEALTQAAMKLGKTAELESILEE